MRREEGSEGPLDPFRGVEEDCRFPTRVDADDSGSGVDRVMEESASSVDEEGTASLSRCAA